MKQAKHWQDYANIVLGVWLLAAPFALGFESHAVAVWNTAIVGVLLLGTAVGAVLLPRPWEDWTETVLGAWLVVSPLFIEFGTHSGAANALVTGLLVLTMSLWAVEDQQLANGTTPSSPL
jgi:hypothetical protein